MASSEEEIIVIGSGKPKGAAAEAPVSIKPQGFESVRVMLKKYSTIAWAMVAGLPGFYSQVLGMGAIPERFSQILWGAAAFGLLCSWVKQRVTSAE